MRILFAGVAIEGGGAEQVIVDIARGCRVAGHEVMIVFLEGSDHIVPQLKAEGILCRRILARTELAASPLADFTPSAISAFRRAIHDFTPDLINAHVPRPTMWLAMALRFTPRHIPLVYTEHNVQEVYPRWIAPVYRIFLPLTTHIIAISDAATQGFIHRWNWSADRITRIYNGIDPVRVTPSRSPADVRAEFAIQPEAPLILNVGNVTARKAQEILVRAMARIHRGRPDARCLIVGGHMHEPATVRALSGEISSLGLDSVVTLTGPRRDIPDLLAAADYFCLSSRQEGFPISILEAMAAGKPVIATNVGGCAEAVLDGLTGHIVPAEDPDAIASACLTLFVDVATTQSMGKAGRERVADHFTLQKAVSDHLKLFSHMVSQ